MSLEDSDPKNPPRPLPEITKSDNGLVDIGREDLVPREKKRLGDYVAYLTKIVNKNEYPISAGSETFNIKSPSGNPAPVVDEAFGAEKRYVDTLDGSDNGQKAKSIFESSSESGLLDTDTPFQIKKGKSDDNKRTGTEIFREIDEKLGEAEVPLRIEAVQLANNRFNAKSPAYDSGQKEGTGENSLGSLIIQPTLGSHSPGKFPKKASDGGSNYIAIPINKLKQFGIMTMLNASGEANVPTPGEDNNYLQSLEATVSTQVPGIARLGKRVEASRFDGVRILNQINPEFKKELRDKNIAGRPVLSYGNVNSVLVPFDGLLSASSINSAAVLSLTISGMLKSLYLFLNALSANQKSVLESAIANTSIIEEKKLRLGSYSQKDSLEATFKPYNESYGINLVTTRYPYFECVNRGIEVFFYGKKLSSEENFLESTGEVQRSHGYQNVIFRNLVRGTSDLLVGLVSSFTEEGRSAYDVDPNLGGTGNVISDLVETAFGIIKIVNSSRLLKFMNVLAIIGEVSIVGDSIGTYGTIDSINDIGEDDEGKEVPKVGVLHAKNRLSDNFGGKLAWGKTSLKSLYLLPSEVLTAARRFDGDNNRFSDFTREKGFRQASGGRFSQEQVEAFENYLEADYMPFYFHDLRTNEIISFHAFLEKISDSYNVDYAENEGYGRIGKVYTYKNTDRSIDLEFSIVATSSEDFDEMWYSINKLITLLYPQYTEGRALQSGNNAFIQPFSQIPSASPIMRLRLGDIFKSNYNKFNLARIFGIGSSNFFLENQQQVETQTEQNRQEIERARQRVNSRMLRGDWQVGDEAILPANWDASWNRGHSPISRYIRIAVEGNTRTRQGTDIGPDLKITSNVEVRIDNINTQRASVEGVQHLYTVSIKQPSGEVQQGQFSVSPSVLRISEDFVNRTALQSISQPVSETDTLQQDQQAINDFFASSGESPNPIFKSFESVRGRGLAGFIKSFNLNIEQNFPWETVGLNNRAPKLVRVAIQFLPIHDLQPGIDSNGFNTAPIYNVGNMMRKANSDSGGKTMPAENLKYKSDTELTTNRNGPRGSST